MQLCVHEKITLRAHSDLYIAAMHVAMNLLYVWYVAALLIVNGTPTHHTVEGNPQNTTAHHNAHTIPCGVLLNNGSC